jgi:hypothetical protein
MRVKTLEFPTLDVLYEDIDNISVKPIVSCSNSISGGLYYIILLMDNILGLPPTPLTVMDKIFMGEHPMGFSYL